MTRLARHAHLVSTGTAALWRRYCTWLLTGDWKATCRRLAAVAVAGWFLGGILLAARSLMWLLTAAWLIAAWRTGRALERQEQAEAAFVQLLADAIGDRNGVLLTDVLLLLHRAEMHLDWTVADIRAQCEALDIPVRDSLKVDGRVSIGVHTEDLTRTWDIHTTPPPAPSGNPERGSDLHNYPTTSDEEGLTEGDVDHEEECDTPHPDTPDDDFEDHLTDALDVLRPVVAQPPHPMPS